MADEQLDTLPADGKLPDTLPSKPDHELAEAWVTEKGGKVDFYVLTGTAGALVAARAGYLTCTPPYIAYGGRKVYSVPQLRTIEDEQRQAKFQESLNPKPVEQPNWDWGKPDGVNDIIAHVPPKPPMTHSQNVYIEDQAEIDKRLDFSNGWVPNPEDLNQPQPDYLKPKPVAPAPVVAAPDLAGNQPSISPQNPYTAEWIVESTGMRVVSTLSQDDAINKWNAAIADQKNAIADAVAAKP
ncbi:hypothetical protein H0K60_004488 [Salmonella enterica]|nr:hypothetical protein [Salmonella enterica]EFR2649731.1 hypothetical protein [Salmonella enterica]EFS1408080.1 hypothetical protein [Salmonella enterica]EHQ8162528.1 hypothetical protein [Salmonella enterica]EJZ9218181.1 hypothetical protein [Salmonella enterica]